MQIGIMPPLTAPYCSPAVIGQVGRAVEAAGFHSLWVPEHVLLFDEYGSRYPYSDDGRLHVGQAPSIIDPFALLSYLAAVTTTLRLGTGICLVPQRNPVYTAKEVASVDVLSGGRVDFGVGIGWLAEEFAALNVPWERRAARTREYLDVMRSLWTEPVSSYDGEFYHLESCRQYPKPVQKPHPPIIFGGESKAALRRVAEVGDGWYGFAVTPEDTKTHLATLDGLLARAGRKRSDLHISIRPAPGREIDHTLVDEYQQLGVDQVIIVVGASTAENLLRRIDELAAATM